MELTTKAESQLVLANLLSKTTSTYPGFIGRNRRYLSDQF